MILQSSHWCIDSILFDSVTISSGSGSGSGTGGGRSSSSSGGESFINKS